MEILLRRPSHARGSTELGWLQSKHSFSFGEYYDPEAMGFRSLRVINDDIVAPGRGFGEHPHRNAEIFSYVLEGELAHRDSMGNGAVIEVGQVQYMSAGSGVTHSEFNPSKEHRTHFLQVWLVPEAMGGEPRYASHTLPIRNGVPMLTPIFSSSGADNTIAIRQNAAVSIGSTSEKGGTIAIPADRERPFLYLHAIQGDLTLTGAQDLESLHTGDGIGIHCEEATALVMNGKAQVLIFRLE